MVMERTADNGELRLVFLEAVASGNLEAVITSLSTDPRLINAQHPESGNTPLIAAAEENRSEVITLLLEHGADVTLYNCSNQTAVHVANVVIRTQLLTAVTRTEFPQLTLAQAAWQGDLEVIQHLLSREHCQYVNSMNEQGLTPVMLAVRDVDLFDGLAMETEHRPVDVLRELLNHHGDAQLLDASGKSAINYVSATQSPLRGQLTALLDKSPPPSDTQDGACCDFCPDTKPLLYDTPLPRLKSPNIHSEVPGKELSCGGSHTDGVSEDLDPGAEIRTFPDTEEESASPAAIETADHMHRKKKNSFSRHRFADPSLEHLSLQPATMRYPLLPPLHMKKDENVSQMESLGLGYLVEGSHSTPNISELHLRTDPLRNIKYIKENIRQRLGSAESSRDNQTYPPLSRSPRSSQSVRLTPLSRTKLRSKEEIKISNNALNSDPFTKTRANGLLCGHNTIKKAMDNSEDLVLSKDLIQISFASLIGCESTHSLVNDLSLRIAQQSLRTGSGRKEIVERYENLDSAGLHNSCINGMSQLHVNDQTQMRSATESEFSLQGEQLQIHEDREGIMRNIPDEEGELVPDPSGKTKLEKQDSSSLSRRLTNENRAAEDIVQNPEAIPFLTLPFIEPIKGDISRTPRLDPVPFVHITFSKQGDNKRERGHVFATRKTNLVSQSQNVSHSFNIHALKDNKKTKKSKKARSMSAPDCATKQRPLSISNKGVPLPAMVFSSVPLPSKVSKKFTHSESSSIHRSRQRSQTQSSVYTTKRLTSSVNTPVPPRAKTSLDFQGLEYSDMFVEIKAQDSGPVISQMFATPVYVNTSKPCRDASSASSNRSCSSKGTSASSSRDSSARASKKPKLKNKKIPSAPSHRRRNSVTKQVAGEDVEKNTEKIVISGTDWEIQTIKQNVAFSGNINCQFNGITDPTRQNHSGLSIIKEATIENSLTINGTAKATLIKMFKELKKSCNNVESTETKPSALTLPMETIKAGGIQQSTCLINSNEQKDDAPGVQDPEAVSLMQSFQNLYGDEQPSEVIPESTLVHLASNENFWTEILIENSVNEKNLDQENSLSQTLKRIDNYADSERLTDDLIFHLEKNLVLLNESSDAKSLVSQRGEDYQSLNVHDQQDVEVHGQSSNLKQFSRSTSLKDSNANTNLTENHSQRSNNDSSILWIKGEVLGKGAYGTVYRGLTSQGELIAAKQVTLHGSDPAVAEKEYKKLQEEVDLLKTLKHVNIVGYLGTCLQDTVVTIFMEFVPGGSISSILRHFGPLQESVISKYTSHILQGIAYLHENRVVHRDIKGNNVMLMPNGVIKLIDFGCAKRLNGLSMNGTQWEMLKSMHGTPYWMAPEVICESGHGEKSDIWSIGCTVFEMATGKPPLAHMNKLAAMFYIGSKKGLMPTLPGHFSKRARTFVDLCLTRDQEDRPFAEQLLQHSFIRQKT
ncbi:mitogen-activated protein kinase kinase kinase 19 [Mixophyes fleayi]|uniref:mitogen-activated protein kinase kinase kinase 19 n=1 Tax=Mixophyes fleayi TaxID=3061075 RepID=UPI003F4DB395